jgi:hypothetical protein
VTARFYPTTAFRRPAAPKRRRAGFDLAPEGPFVVGMKCWDIPSGEKKILCGMSGIVVLYAVSEKPLSPSLVSLMVIPLHKRSFLGYI